MTAIANPLAELSLDQLRTRTSMKWRAYPPDVLPLWLAEMDVTPAESIKIALAEAVTCGDTGYPAGTAYAEALRSFAQDRWDWDGVDVARVFPVADVITGITEMLSLVTRPGDPVVINPPVYANFTALIEGMGRRVRDAPLGPDGRLDLTSLERAFGADPAPAAYLLCSPHNPTGAVHTPAELSAVAQLARRHGVRIVADEIHAPLVLPGALFTPFLSVPGAENAFSVFSASKSFNLAGLKAAVALGGPEAVEDLERIGGDVRYGPSHLGEIAHVAALRAGGPWLDAVLVGLDDNRRLLRRLLDDRLPEVRWLPPQATYLAWLDCRPLELPGPAADVFLDRGRVAVSPGAIFGAEGEGFVRLNFATSPQILVQAIDAMASAC